jgi:hypothetical protein
MGYQLGTYAADMLALVASTALQVPDTLDWVGTSMGGLIGMAGVRGQPVVLPLRSLHQRATHASWCSTTWGRPSNARHSQRIGQYLGAHGCGLRRSSTRPTLVGVLSAVLRAAYARAVAGADPASTGKPLPDGGKGSDAALRPGHRVPFKALTRSMPRLGEAALWQLYDQITARTLLLRGAQSDLLSHGHGPGHGAARAAR